MQVTTGKANRVFREKIYAGSLVHLKNQRPLFKGAFMAWRGFV